MVTINQKGFHFPKLTEVVYLLDKACVWFGDWFGWVGSYLFFGLGYIYLLFG